MFLKAFYQILGAAIAGMESSPKIKCYDGVERTGSIFYSNKLNHSTLSALVMTGDSSYAATLSKILTGTIEAGTKFGNGTTEPAFNDWCLSGSSVTTISGTANVTCETDDTGVTITSVFTLTNTGTSPITISEVGRIGSNLNCLVERVLLDVPVTIAPGGVGQVTFTTRFDFPW